MPEDKVIYSAAVVDSPEIHQAQAHVLDNPKRVFPPMLYAQFLGEISKYMCTVAVTGTHGKSTTTALTATALATHHPAFGLGIVGANVTSRGQKNYLTSVDTLPAVARIITHIFDPKSPPIEELMKRYIFVVEADEYNRHFLHLDVDYALITNIELDHADIYGDEATYIAAFDQFARKVKQSLWMLTGAKGSDALASHPHFHALPAEHFPFVHLLGAHNHGNATLASVVSKTLLDQLPTNTTTQADLQQTIATFPGLRRRGELLAHNTHGAPIISDYGHHPTELASTLDALREKYPDRKIVCIFQPHQARRVMEFRDAFVAALRTTDQVVIYDIYAAREHLGELTQQFQTFKNVTSITQLGELFAQHAGGTYTTDFSTITDLLQTTAADSLIVMFTAGNLDFHVRTYLHEQ